MIMEPGILDWKGIRVYLKMQEYADSGPGMLAGQELQGQQGCTLAARMA
jgi:hypothetical protein